MRYDIIFALIIIFGALGFIFMYMLFSCKRVKMNNNTIKNGDIVGGNKNVVKIKGSNNIVATGTGVNIISTGKGGNVAVNQTATGKGNIQQVNTHPRTKKVVCKYCGNTIKENKKCKSCGAANSK